MCSYSRGARWWLVAGAEAHQVGYTPLTLGGVPFQLVPQLVLEGVRRSMPF